MLGLPISGRKSNVPKTRSSPVEFYCDLKSFRCGLRVARNIAPDALVRAFMFEDETSARNEILGRKQQRPMVVHVRRECADDARLSVNGDVQFDAHAQHDALAAPALILWRHLRAMPWSKIFRIHACRLAKS